ncbi:MAG: hypothetical protein KAX65_05665 [Caldilineaceae bacterium]|nr:hypothetical protein [Caldilineaceae bacterium]
METYEIDAAITLRLIEADGAPAVEHIPRHVVVSGSLSALQLIVGNQGWKQAISDTATNLLVSERKANQD